MIKKFYSIEDAFNELEINSALAPTHFITDGQIHRFDANKKNDRAGWYIGQENGLVVGNWKLGKKVYVVPKKTTYFDDREVEKMTNHEEDLIEKLESAKQLYFMAKPHDPAHGYLIKKKIKLPNFVKQIDSRLVVPLMSENFELKSLQFIDETGEKRFFNGLPSKGLFFPIGEKNFIPETEETIYLCEGVATGATIFDQTKTTTICALSASNLVEVSTIFRKTYPNKKLIVIADNDQNGVGEAKARETGLPVILIPEVGKDANDYVNEGGNLNELIEQQMNDQQIEKYDYFISGKELINRKIGLRWLIAKAIPQNGLCMVHGASGAGKSFWAVDLALRVALNMDYYGLKINNPDRRPVVYLVGEGIYGLFYRYQAWCKYHNIDNIDNFYLSLKCFIFTDDKDFNEIKKELQKIKPCLIVVDTLHRHWDGDENSSKDAKQMIDLCADLQNTFSATVLLVHHTGVNSEAQLRGRGSSAWRAALDAEFSLQKRVDNSILVVQVKNKEEAPIKPLSFWLEELETGEVNEDGEPISSCVLIQRDVENRIENKNEKDLAVLISRLIKNNKTKIDNENKKMFISKKDFTSELFDMIVENIKCAPITFDLTEEQILKKAKKELNDKMKKSGYRFLATLMRQRIIDEEGEFFIVTDPKFFDLTINF